MSITVNRKARAAGAVIAGTLAAAASLSLAPTASAAANDTLTPGVGLANRLTLGMSRSTVVNSLGAPQCNTGASCFVGNAGSGGYVQIYFYNGAVDALAFENQSGYKTPQGVTAASTLSQVAAIYGVGVTGNVAAATNRGYAAQAIADYSCNDSGCRVSGSHLRHFIFTPGKASRSQNTASGSIALTNTSRRYTTVSSTVTVKNASGQTVATTRVSMYLPPNGTISYNPADLWDVSSWAAGTYSYTTATTKGSFSLTAKAIPLF